MAKSESQALQVSVIIFAILTIALSISTYYFFTEHSKAALAEILAREDAASMKTAYDITYDENKRLKVIIGDAEDAKLDKVEEAWEAARKKAAATLPQDVQAYRPALESLLTTLAQRNQEVAQERKDVEALKAKFAALEKKNQVDLAASKKSFVDQVNLFRTALNGKDETLGQKDGLIDTLTQEKAKIQRDADTDRKAAIDLQAKMEKEVEQAITVRDVTDKKIKELTTETFEVADGEIRWINQRSKTAYINLGSADGLRTQISFSVYGRDAADVARKEKKGSIEVLKILSAHLAEANITFDIFADPILPGDKIYTPLWHPGRREHFAIAGNLDMDGDGEPDNEAIRDLITMNGAILDAEWTPGEEIRGEITINTRYLLRGKSPTEGDKNFTQMIRDARRWGVETMTIDKFKDHIGFTDLGKPTRFGRHSNPDDFREVRLPGEQARSSGTTSKLFKLRRPPGRKKTGAY